MVKNLYPQSFQCRLHRRLYLRFGDSADNTVSKLTFFKNEECRDSSDAILLTNIGMRIYIDFGNNEFPLVGFRQFFYNWRNLPTRPTPVRRSRHGGQGSGPAQPTSGPGRARRRRDAGRGRRARRMLSDPLHSARTRWPARDRTGGWVRVRRTGGPDQ